MGGCPPQEVHRVGEAFQGRRLSLGRRTLRPGPDNAYGTDNISDCPYHVPTRPTRILAVRKDFAKLQSADLMDYDDRLSK